MVLFSSVRSYLLLLCMPHFLLKLDIIPKKKLLYFSVVPHPGAFICIALFIYLITSWILSENCISVPTDLSIWCCISGGAAWVGPWSTWEDRGVFRMLFHSSYDYSQLSRSTHCCLIILLISILSCGKNCSTKSNHFVAFFIGTLCDVGVGYSDSIQVSS